LLLPINRAQHKNLCQSISKFERSQVVATETKKFADMEIVRYRTALNYFVQDLAKQSPRLPRHRKNIFARAAAAWKNLPAVDRVKYEELAAADKQRWLRELDASKRQEEDAEENGSSVELNREIPDEPEAAAPVGQVTREIPDEPEAAAPVGQVTREIPDEPEAAAPVGQVTREIPDEPTAAAQVAEQTAALPSYSVSPGGVRSLGKREYPEKQDEVPPNKWRKFFFW
jgi:hypothetical protein